MKQELLCYQSVFKIVSVYLVLAVLGLCCCTTFALAVVSGAALQRPCPGSSPRRLLLLWGLQVSGLQCLQHVGSVVAAFGLSCWLACGLFPDEALNHTHCIGRWIPIHCTTKEVLINLFLIKERLPMSLPFPCLDISPRQGQKWEEKRWSPNFPHPSRFSIPVLYL